MIIDGINTQSNDLISDAFAKHYSEIGLKLKEKLKRTHRDPHLHDKKCDKTFHFSPINQYDIEKLLSRLPNKKSCGWDGISNTFIKEIGYEISAPLGILINESLMQGIVPINYKQAIVKPLYKGKSKTDIINYRPISLLPVLSKILEKIVHKQLTKFLSENNLLFEGQYGLRENRSTCDALLELVGNIIENWEKNQIIITVFCDMSKAFDCLDYVIFLKRIEKYGIKDNEKKWFSSYLTNSSMQVNYNNVFSNKRELQIGTPQGSVLGPVYYIWFVDCINKCLKYSNITIFADDATLLISGKRIHPLIVKLEDDLQKLKDWFDSNYLTINIDKTNYMIFNYNAPDSVEIKLAEKTMTQVKHTKILGLYIQNDLKWDRHLDHILKKIAYPCYVLKRER